VIATVQGKRVPLGEPGGVYLSAAGELTPPATFYAGQRLAFRMPAGGRQSPRIGGFGVTCPMDGIDDQDPIALAQALVTTQISSNLSVGLFPVIQPHSRVGWGELKYVPTTLLDALWLQFAEAVCGEKVYRECVVCGKPFEISPDAARTNRILCSSSCKVKAYRTRKARACKLWDKGITLATIVRETGSDTEQVQKWLAAHLRRQGRSFHGIARELDVPVSRVKKWLSKKGGK
jgi:hypothetical protein